MKRLFKKLSRRKIVTFTLMLVIFMMSLGYAALSQYIEIEGLAMIDKSWIIAITNVESSVTGAAVNKSSTYVGSTVTMNATIPNNSSTVTYTITLKNEGNLKAKLHSIEKIEDKNTSVSYTISGVEEGVTTLNPGETNTAIVTIKVKDGITSISDTEKSVMLSFYYVENSDGDTDGDIDTNEPTLTYLSGNNTLSLNSAVSANLSNYKITGNSVQESDNLFDESLIITNLYPNASVFATGTVWRGFTFECEPNTTYTLTKMAGQTSYLGTSSEYPANGVAINVKVNNPTETSVTITTGENDKYVTAFFYRTNVDTIDYQTMLDSIEIRQVTPTPDTPLEILSVGDRTKNLLDPSEKTTTSDFIFYYQQNGIKLKAGTYTLSISETVAQIDVRNMDNTTIKTVYTKSSLTFTLEEDQIVYFMFYKSGLDLTLVGQLEEGTEATEYEPYGYKIPVTVGGKNLLPYPYHSSNETTVNDITYTVNQDNSINAKGTATATAYYYLFNSKELSFDYDTTISVNGLVQGVGVVYVLDGTSTYLSATTPSRTIEKGKTITSIRLYVTTGSQVDLSNIKIQLEKGTVVTEYEPYMGSTTTNIYLDEPLRKVGDYEDYIDFENKKVVRNIGYKKIISSSIAGKSGASTENFHYYFIYFNDAMAIADNVNIPILSNIGGGSLADFNKKNKEGIFTNINTTFFIAFFDKTTLADARQFVTDNNVYANYILATPIEQPIELPNIYIPQGNVTLSVNSNGLTIPIEVSYYKN